MFCDRRTHALHVTGKADTRRPLLASLTHLHLRVFSVQTRSSLLTLDSSLPLALLNRHNTQNAQGSKDHPQVRKVRQQGRWRQEEEGQVLSQLPEFAVMTAMLTSPADPNMPKRGLSAYMFFANDQRDKVREDNPGIKFGKQQNRSLSPFQMLSDVADTLVQARLARSSERNGRVSPTSRRPHTRPRLPPTRSVTKRRRLPTLL